MNTKAFQRLVSAAGLLVLCTAVLVAPTNATETSTTQPAATWARRDPKQWPQLVLTNFATFKGHTQLRGASAFLMRMPDGSLVVGTAKHLIKQAGGVDPPLPLIEFEQALQRWHAFQRTKEDQFVDARKLAITPNHEQQHDWLLLELVVNPGAKLPATPLVPRATPAQIGETVYLVGVPYSDEKSPQNVYRGKVTARPQKSYFEYEFTPPVEIRGFSGAPIVDANGLLLGHVVSRKGQLKQQDGREIECGAEDATLALHLWLHRAEPVIPANIAFQLQLPAGWDVTARSPAGVVTNAHLSSPLAQCKFDFVAVDTMQQDVTLEEYAVERRESTSKIKSAANIEFSQVQSRDFSGQKVFLFDGTAHTGQLRTRSMIFERQGKYCTLMFFTEAPNWAAAQLKFDEVVRQQY